MWHKSARALRESIDDFRPASSTMLQRVVANLPRFADDECLFLAEGDITATISALRLRRYERRSLSGMSLRGTYCGPFVRTSRQQIGPATGVAMNCDHDATTLPVSRSSRPRAAPAILAA
jgi:hypothetical protein